MATRIISAMQGGGGHSKAKWVLLALLVLIVAVLIYAWPTMRAYSQTGAAYSARVVCSCRYIGGRGLDDCEKDLEPGMQIVSLSEAANAKRIDATVPLMASEAAEFREGFGCVLMTEKAREAAR
ncbi:hypothetical protein [Blastomonas sp.]|uniref:hypothetical protein n=1 Tax=Blastomonas sp. TaxID=1909299 RepID=UPI00261C38B2|nr:hypothetical protein [Blastomonas sp.]MDM7955502.1 hypothetical protein [Blastomonas sp.]